MFCSRILLCAISNQSWHLHKSDFPLQNTQNDVFCCGILHLCNLKSELTVAQISFSTVKHSKRRVLWWVMAFLQFKVRVGTCKKLIFHCKSHEKTCFFCRIQNICNFKSELTLAQIRFYTEKHSKNAFCGGILQLYNLKSELTVVKIGFSTVKHSKRRVLRLIICNWKSVDTFKKLIFHRKTYKKTCFGEKYRICAISNQNRHLHKSDFLLQNTQKNVFCVGILQLCNLNLE